MVLSKNLRFKMEYTLIIGPSQFSSKKMFVTSSFFLLFLYIILNFNVIYHVYLGQVIGAPVIRGCMIRIHKVGMTYQVGKIVGSGGG